MGREAEECSTEGTVCVKAPGGEAHEHQRQQKGGHVLENAKMVQDKTAKASRPGYNKGVQSGDTKGCQP